MAYRGKQLYLIWVLNIKFLHTEIVQRINRKTTIHLAFGVFGIEQLGVMPILIPVVVCCHGFSGMFPFGSSKMGVVSSSSIIAEYSSNAYYDETLKISQQIKLADVRPSSVTFARVLPVCSSS